mmetsp:Transcript_35168/g.89033  ORF Transcript_35168/g.89033 Transcript_35168/m.89033 type:complete len:149 (-) Transcript_35168:489-935(-)|eukprot:CAMPEP_0202868002 /NCGR_PEP_ID=MMETSP1391-20130828/9978_1 /ASSEMBLY_ACC=CAM_ASM_000867 /TAXON_ID=1034604 /ORGANISM="Chlamydomonas leiostraca, Strain SAG 11-49" /LENGTH=148 /DNA_ID=CAMNT_0049548097 /DNA_START=177 /DNA_END=623 /DNA_ORIENTATION=-
MAAVATAQIEALITQLQHEGVLDEQFSMLITLQDEASPDFVTEVVQLYFEDSVSKIDKIGQMLSTPSPDFNELDQLVHQFKGSSASLGAQMIAQLCIKLREQCQLQNSQGCIVLVGQIRQAYDLLKSKLELFMQLENHRKQCMAAGMQ